MNTAKRAQFTPGPWEVTGPNTCEVITSNTGTYKPIRTIAKVNGYWDGEVLANMRLIAAAPAMYEELGKCVSLIRALQERLNAHEEMCNFDDEEIAGAIAALAQAEGSNHA